ncbi:MAG: hypothetical protein JSW03_00520 [Candidatus Eiseniibacteriota bacterium]|nr:MAG: hypothetical protein JSW03_00520 [Candidatus Eisenbacteria bacterium]
MKEWVLPIAAAVMKVEMFPCYRTAESKRGERLLPSEVRNIIFRRAGMRRAGELLMTRSPLRITLLLVLTFSLCGSPAVRAADSESARAAALGAEAPALVKPDAEGRGLKTALLASTFLLGSVAVILEIESDKSYSRYMDVAHPSRMEAQYDRAERYRDLSTAALVTAEMCAVAFVVLALSERSPEESQPGEVRITLEARASGAGVTVVW